MHDNFPKRYQSADIVPTGLHASGRKGEKKCLENGRKKGASYFNSPASSQTSEKHLKRPPQPVTLTFLDWGTAGALAGKREIGGKDKTAAGGSLDLQGRRSKPQTQNQTGSRDGRSHSGKCWFV